MNNVIQLAIATKIFNSDQKPTIEIELELLNSKKVFASSGEGESRGRDEGNLENADIAIKNFGILKENFLKLVSFDQKQFDNDLSELYKTKKIGINTALIASIAHIKAKASLENKELWEIIQAEFDFHTKPSKPQEICVLVEGGKHSKNTIKLGIQEISIIGLKQVIAAKKILIKALQIKNIKFSTGLEGGIAVQTNDSQKILSILKDFNLALDIASQTGLSKDNVDLLLKNKNVKIIEDPFDQNQICKWQNLNHKDILVVADDLTVTRVDLIEKYQNCFNSIVIKPTQAGTVTQTIEAILKARQLGKKIIVSHRGRETMDDFLADFAIAINSDYVKFGNPSQKERKVKYDRLAKILVNRHYQ